MPHEGRVGTAARKAQSGVTAGWVVGAAWLIGAASVGVASVTFGAAPAFAEEKGDHGEGNQGGGNQGGGNQGGGNQGGGDQGGGNQGGHGGGGGEDGGHGGGGGEDGGHEDGGGEDGGHEDGGTDEGDHEEGGGKGKGKGKGSGSGDTVPDPIVAAAIASDAALPRGKGSVRGGVIGPGTYLRLELGSAQGQADGATWRPSADPADPQVFFDIDTSATGFGAIAVGRSLGNGWRVEGALNVFGSADFNGPWSYTDPVTTGPHADVAGATRSVALMANGYYDFETGGRAVPFVTMGVGVARNSMDDWTRINTASDRTSRSFEGGSSSGFAWTVGVGIAVDVGPVFGSAPAKLEVAWRYFDLGSVSGGTTPLDGSGSGGVPVSPLQFDVTEQVISIGLRMEF